jgi:hypothetical protein
MEFLLQTHVGNVTMSQYDNCPACAVVLLLFVRYAHVVHAPHVLGERGEVSPKNLPDAMDS